jgi:signal transduction histidine kinase
MKFPFKDRALTTDRVLTWAVPLMLACVLAALAVLQYRWSRQASDAATTRMQASLQNSMMNFRQDLSRELGTMCLELQGDDKSSSVRAKSLARKLERWQRTSSLSGLIANVYEWKRSGSENLFLLRLLPSDSRFGRIRWPSRFHKLRELMMTAASDGSLEPGGLHDEPDLDDALAGGPQTTPVAEEGSRPLRKVNGPMIGGIDESIPVLIVPASRASSSTWLLIELDVGVLRDRVFPQLAERYFGDSRTSDYEVAAVADGSERPQVIYSSDAGFGINGQISTDASLNLFGPPALQGVAPPPPLDFVRALRGSSHTVEGPPASIRQPGRAQAGGPQAGGAFDPIRFDPVISGPDGPNWQIVVKHHKGSVAAAVAELRYRNLGISFGVLLVLAASMALIIFNSQRARRLAMLQMDFIAGVSHELRTPVAAILSISENIVDGVVADEQQLLRYGGMIRNQARRLHHLVEQVLRFAATERRTTSYTIRPVQISDVIDEVLENMSNLVTASGFVIERSIEPDLPPVEVDFGVLSQCLQNLITNSVKYGGDGKWIGLRAGSNQKGSAREVSITVEDHGIGIDDEELEHIFEPFYRSPKVAETQIPGTGLGLALAKSFAEAMGGRLTVISEAGKGTAFTVHLPAANGANSQRKGAFAAEPTKN